KANVRGTKKSGRSFDIIKRLRAKGQASAVRYRAARQSLHNLRGGGSWEHVLQELQDSDIKDVASEVFSTDIVRDYNDTGVASGKRKRKAGTMHTQPVVFGSASFEMSWIWMVEGALDTASDNEMDGLIRVEYLKGRARVARSKENMMLIRDERERSLASLEYDAAQWDKRAGGWEGMSAELAEGVRAYACMQAKGRRSLAAHFKAMWMLPAPKRRICVMDRIEIEETAAGDSDAEDDVSPANALRPPLPGLREVLDV
ncbi:hypothetical protein CYLTODRAFT_238073, partial [Cylindrobasidium torrendii FP15055 ss-10]